MERLERFVSYRIHLSSCLNLSRPLSTRRFTDNTTFQLAELGLSRDILVNSLPSVILRNLEAMGNGSVTSVKLRAAVRMRTATLSFVTEPESCH